uniref:CSON004190 protein n=1 Tax=Culicoides sonorensis TaxID=179676 RepID=A0A336LT56_CULSO
MKSKILFLSLLAVTVAQSTINPNYDYPDEKIKEFSVKRALVLNCALSAQTTEEIKVNWKKDGKDVTEISELKGRFTAEGTSFKISNTQEEDAGVYECDIPLLNLNATIEAIATVEVALERNTYVIEGETLRINCKVAGTKPEIMWRVNKNETEIYTESRDRVTLEEFDGVPNAKFTMSDVTMEDRADYTCIGQNRVTKLAGKPAEDTTLVRVKDKYAALWPFLGICVEVAVLCLVIWICEKQRLKKQMEDSDDESEVVGNGRSGDVRRRH